MTAVFNWACQQMWIRGLLCIIWDQLTDVVYINIFLIFSPKLNLLIIKPALIHYSLLTLRHIFMLPSAAVHTRAAECLGAWWRFTDLVWKRWGLCDTVLRFSAAGKPRTDWTAAKLLALSETADPVSHTASYAVLWMQEHTESPLELQGWAAYTSGGNFKTQADSTAAVKRLDRFLGAFIALERWCAIMVLMSYNVESNKNRKKKTLSEKVCPNIWLYICRVSI